MPIEQEINYIKLDIKSILFLFGSKELILIIISSNKTII